MKKLLIAMTAAAVGFGAWADGEQTSTLLNENFDSWTNGTDLEYMTELPEGLWSYTGDTIGAEELKVVTQSGGDNALTLNTGSKVLNAKFDANAPLTIPQETGYIFTSTVNFSDPSDTLPTLADGDKFALVVLDNVESLTTEGMHGQDDQPATNLWVIAGHGVDGTRAYLMQPNSDDDDENLSADFFNRDHTITIKAYNNVMGSGKDANSGFLLKVDDVICTVLRSYKIVNNVINLTEYEGSKYLGYEVNEVALPLRYSNKQLLISRSQDSTLTSVDFQGQGTIDDVSLATTGSDAIFGPDASTLNFVNYGSDGIVSIEFGETPVENGKYTITEAVGSTLTFTVTVADNYVLKATGADVAKDGNDYTLTYTVTSAASQAITLDVYEPAAYIGDTDYKTLAAAVSEASADSTIDLFSDVKLDSAVAIAKNLTINLNGKKLSAALSGAFTSMFKINGSLTLTITDADNGVGVLEVTGGDRVLAMSNRGAATVAINKGTIDAACVVGTGNNTISYYITGGKFLKEANATITPADGYVANGEDVTYWVVTEKPAITTYEVTYAPGNFTIIYGDAAFESGTKLASGTYIFKVVANPGYKVESVMVGAQTVKVNNDGTFEVVVTNMLVNIMVMVQENAFMVSYAPGNFTITKGDAEFDSGTKLESGTYTFKVKADAGYKVSRVSVDGLDVQVDNEGAFKVVVTNMHVNIMVMTEPVPLQPLPENATDANVPTALGRQADTAVYANITTVADYTAFQKWAAKVDGGTSAVADSVNAYAAYVLDAAGLLAGTDKLADADIKVKAFAQDATAQTAGTFALEIKIKDCEIGLNANTAKLEELIVAEGTSELGNDLYPFNKDNVTKTVAIEGGKIKFKVNAKDENITKFFFKMKFNK